MGNIAETKQDGSWVKYVFTLMPEKITIKLYSDSRMTFRAWFVRRDPQIIGGQFGTFSDVLRNTFRKRTSQKKPRNVFQTEKFQDSFWEASTSLFLSGFAFRLGWIYILFIPPSGPVVSLDQVGNLHKQWTMEPEGLLASRVQKFDYVRFKKTCHQFIITAQPTRRFCEIFRSMMKLE